MFSEIDKLDTARSIQIAKLLKPTKKTSKNRDRLKTVNPPTITGISKLLRQCSRPSISQEKKIVQTQREPSKEPPKQLTKTTVKLHSLPQLNQQQENQKSYLISKQPSIQTNEVDLLISLRDVTNFQQQTNASPLFGSGEFKKELVQQYESVEVKNINFCYQY
ncbi:hypothetical protein pb186bvf_004065 [Paramecium bursaria]